MTTPPPTPAELLAQTAEHARRVAQSARDDARSLASRPPIAQPTLSDSEIQSLTQLAQNLALTASEVINLTAPPSLGDTP